MCPPPKKMFLLSLLNSVPMGCVYWLWIRLLINLLPDIILTNVLYVAFKSFLSTIFLGTAQHERFIIHLNQLTGKVKYVWCSFLFYNLLQWSYYALLQTNVQLAHQSTEFLLPLFLKIIQQAVYSAETVLQSIPLLSLSQSHGTWFLWHAVSGTAPVGILPSKSQQQARCDEADVEPSDTLCVYIDFYPLPSGSLHPGTLSKALHTKTLTLSLVKVQAASQMCLCWLMAQLKTISAMHEQLKSYICQTFTLFMRYIAFWLVPLSVQSHM